MRYLPVEYIRHVHSGGVRDGFTDLDYCGYFKLEDLDSVDKFNSDIEIDEYAPGFTAFASNGGGEFLAFDAEGIVYSIPLIGMSVGSAIRAATSWDDFLTHIVDARNSSRNADAPQHPD